MPKKNRKVSKEAAGQTDQQHLFAVIEDCLAAVEHWRGKLYSDESRERLQDMSADQRLISRIEHKDRARQTMAEHRQFLAKECERRGIDSTSLHKLPQPDSSLSGPKLLMEERPGEGKAWAEGEIVLMRLLGLAQSEEEGGGFKPSAQTPARGGAEPADAPDLVTLDEAAAIVHRKKGTLADLKGKGLPEPVVRGKRGQPYLYDWAAMRAFLEELAPMILPERFPANLRR